MERLNKRWEKGDGQGERSNEKGRLEVNEEKVMEKMNENMKKTENVRTKQQKS
jgi:hypothetical protein